MTSTSVVPRQRAVPCPLGRRRAVDRQLERFSPRYRKSVREVAGRDPRLSDLALSFPALLFSLAVPRPDLAPEPLIRLVLSGAGLKELGKLAGLPGWSRRLMPEAFTGPVGQLPDGQAISYRIANHLPRSPRQAACWLDSVSFACRWGTPEMACWIAREVLDPKLNVKAANVKERLPLLALYAWYSGQPGTFGHSLIQKPWSTSMSCQTAWREALDWHESVAIEAHIGGGPIPDLWLEPKTVDGYEFRPLATASDIRAEASAMEHCVKRYGDSLARGATRLWSIHREGARVATLSVGRRYRSPLLEISQLVGPRYSTADEAIWWCAHQWLALHGELSAVPKAKPFGAVPPDRASWVRLWRPYWLAKRALPAWLPLSPSARELNRLGC